MEFANLEPFGFPLDDHRFGILRAMIATIWGGQAKATDFMMKPPAPVSPEEAAATRRAELADKLRAIFPDPSGTLEAAGSTLPPKL